MGPEFIATFRHAGSTSIFVCDNLAAGYVVAAIAIAMQALRVHSNADHFLHSMDIYCLSLYMAGISERMRRMCKDFNISSRLTPPSQVKEPLT